MPGAAAYFNYLLALIVDACLVLDQHFLELRLPVNALVAGSRQASDGPPQGFERPAQHETCLLQTSFLANVSSMNTVELAARKGF
jgi:hypothetical protein